VFDFLIILCIPTHSITETNTDMQPKTESEDTLYVTSIINFNLDLEFMTTKSNFDE